MNYIQLQNRALGLIHKYGVPAEVRGVPTVCVQNESKKSMEGTKTQTDIEFLVPGDVLATPGDVLEVGEKFRIMEVKDLCPGGVSIVKKLVVRR